MYLSPLPSVSVNKVKGLMSWIEQTNKRKPKQRYLLYMDVVFLVKWGVF